MPILSLLIFIPIIGSLLMAFSPERFVPYFRWVTLIVTSIELLLCGYLYVQFNTQVSDYQSLEEYDWITLPLGNLGVGSIDYLLGVDGISMPMVLLTGIVMFVGAISSFEITDKKRGYHALYLLLTGSIIGCFLALDMFLFYLFLDRKSVV